MDCENECLQAQFPKEMFPGLDLISKDFLFLQASDETTQFIYCLIIAPGFLFFIEEIDC